RTFFFASQPPRPPYHLRNEADKHRRPGSVAPATAGFTSRPGRGIPGNARGFGGTSPLAACATSTRSPASLPCEPQFFDSSPCSSQYLGPARCQSFAASRNSPSAQTWTPRSSERPMRSPPSIYCLAACLLTPSAHTRPELRGSLVATIDLRNPAAKPGEIPSEAPFDSHASLIPTPRPVRCQNFEVIDSQLAVCPTWTPRSSERPMRSPPSIYCLAAARPNTSARARLSFSSANSQLAASAPECPGPASSHVTRGFE